MPDTITPNETKDVAKLDPFKPQQPRIPGVPSLNAPPPAGKSPEHIAAGASTEPDLGQRMALYNSLARAGILILATGVLLLWAHMSSRKVVASARIASPKPAVPAAKSPEFTGKEPLGPGEVATTDELAKPWSAKKFLYPDPVTSEPTSAIVVHLPGGANWGLLLKAPYGTCEMEYVTDLKKLQTDYNFQAQHPMVGDPCSRSVFDLTRYGNSPSGLVRGEIEQGSAIRPPTAIEIRMQGKQVIAGRLE